MPLVDVSWTQQQKENDTSSEDELEMLMEMRSSNQLVRSLQSYIIDTDFMDMYTVFSRLSNEDQRKVQMLNPFFQRKSLVLLKELHEWIQAVPRSQTLEEAQMSIALWSERHGLNDSRTMEYAEVFVVSLFAYMQQNPLSIHDVVVTCLRSMVGPEAVDRMPGQGVYLLHENRKLFKKVFNLFSLPRTIPDAIEKYPLKS